MRAVGLLPAPLLALALVGCRPDSGLQKVNASPDAQITAPAADAALLEGARVTLRGAASDANHDASELLTRWFVDDVELCAAAAPSADGTTVCEVVVPRGETMAARLEVSDPDGAAGTANGAWSVTPNQPPQASIASPVADGVYYSDQLVTLRGAVSDAEDDPAALLVAWESSRDGLLAGAFSAPDGSGGLLGATMLSEGAHFLTLRVTDTAGNTQRADVTIDVGPPNSAPDCAITEPVDGSAGERGALVTFRGSVSDVDVPADGLSVAWTSDKDGALGESTPTSGGSVTFPYADLSIDTHVVSMRVTDEVGATCTAEVVYTVGSAPTLTLESPAPGEIVNEGEGIAFTALVADAEDPAGDLRVTWESSLDGLLFEGPPDSAGVAGFIDASLTRGDHILTVTVTDTAGLYATARGSVSVNGAPTAPVVELSPAAPLTDDALRVTLPGPSSDPEGEALVYVYAWSRDGVPSAASTTDTLPASATSRGEVWSVTVTATDGLATSPAGTASVTIGNSAPTLSAPTLTPDPAYEDDVLVCSAGATADADGDSVDIVYDWSVDGVALGRDATTLDGSLFARGQSVQCSATPTDGTDTGATVTSGVVTIGNSAPRVSSVTLTPGAVRTDDTLTATAVASDPDGDALSMTYDWYVDGALVRSGASATLSGVTAFDRDQTVFVVARASDGTDTGTATSASVVVDNTPPSAPGVTITPGDAADGDDLTCSVTTPATDGDGDALTYTFAWTVDGVAYSGATDSATSSVVPGADVEGGQTWTCEGVAGDGDAVSPAATDEQEIVPQTCSHEVSLYQDGALVHSAVFTTTDLPTRLYPFFAVNSTAASTRAGATIDNISITDGAGAPLLSETFASGAFWTLYGGGIGGTSITSGVASANADWSDFISTRSIDITGGIVYSASVTWSSSTDRVFLGMLDTYATGRGMRSIVCRGIGVGWACPDGAISTLAAYDFGAATYAVDVDPLRPGVPNVGGTSTYTFTTVPTGACW